MAKANGAKTDPVVAEKPAITAPPAAVKEDSKDAPKTAEKAADAPEAVVTEVSNDTPKAAEKAADAPEAQDIEDCLNALKTLLSTVEKLQKVRQEVGDIKPLLVRMLDGEVLSGEELEQLKTGVGGLFRLVRAYSDHQTALNHAQPARSLLDQVLKTTGKG